MVVGNFLRYFVEDFDSHVEFRDRDWTRKTNPLCASWSFSVGILPSMGRQATIFPAYHFPSSASPACVGNIPTPNTKLPPNLLFSGVTLYWIYTHRGTTKEGMMMPKGRENTCDPRLFIFPPCMWGDMTPIMRSCGLSYPERHQNGWLK